MFYVYHIHEDDIHYLRYNDVDTLEDAHKVLENCRYQMVGAIIGGRPTDAWRATQNLDKPWSDPPRRSSMVGDIFINCRTGEAHMVARIGFAAVVASAINQVEL